MASRKLPTTFDGFERMLDSGYAGASGAFVALRAADVDSLLGVLDCLSQSPRARTDVGMAFGFVALRCLRTALVNRANKPDLLPSDCVPRSEATMARYVAHLATLSPGHAAAVLCLLIDAREVLDGVAIALAADRPDLLVDYAPIHLVAAAGSVQMLEALLCSGVSLDTEGPGGERADSLAAGLGRTDITQTLAAERAHVLVSCCARGWARPARQRPMPLLICPLARIGRLDLDHEPTPSRPRP